jgi:hypothetical protein
MSQTTIGTAASAEMLFQRPMGCHLRLHRHRGTGVLSTNGKERIWMTTIISARLSPRTRRIAISSPADPVGCYVVPINQSSEVSDGVASRRSSCGASALDRAVWPLRGDPDSGARRPGPPLPDSLGRRPRDGLHPGRRLAASRVSAAKRGRPECDPQGSRQEGHGESPGKGLGPELAQPEGACVEIALTRAASRINRTGMSG